MRPTTYIKHDRKSVSVSAPLSVDLYLFLSVKLNGDDMSDKKGLKAKYATKLERMYGERYDWNGTYSSACNF